MVNQRNSITGELVRNADSQSPPNTYQIRNSGGGGDSALCVLPIFYQTLQATLIHPKV